MIQTIKRRAAANVLDIPGLIRKFCICWLSAVVIEYLLLPVQLRNLEMLDGLAHMAPWRVAAITCILFALLLLVPRQKTAGRIERWCLAGVFGILAAVTLTASFSKLYLAACLLILGILIVFAIRGWNDTAEPAVMPEKSHKAFVWITAILAAGFFAFVCAWTVGRIYCFSSSTYDFGIFVQMFHNMAETGLPMTTLERSKWLSHFDVHVSPIYYLMLPVYWLFPFPATLQVLQAAVLASAVIPLWKIAKHHGFSGLQQMLICVLLLVLPAYSGGTNFDLHENCFLTPLILWLLYGIDKKNTAITAVAAILTLTVKEDAAVYVAVIGLWLIVRSLLRIKNIDKRSLITGVSLLAVSVGWFFAVTGYLAEHGDGVMAYRYDNFMYDSSSSLLTVVTSVFLNPMKAVFECASTAKWTFILQTMGPLLFLPLFTRRYERYLLLIPYVLVNLLSDYSFQHNIFFQYNFGTTAFLLYLTIVNLADLQINRVRIGALSVAVAIGAALFVQNVIPQAKPHPIKAIRSYQHYEDVRAALASIPEDASVTATPFYTPHLAQRKVIYDLGYCSAEDLLSSEYVALQIFKDSVYNRYATNGQDNGFENLTKILTKRGYSVYASIDDTLIIYRKE